MKVAVLGGAGFIGSHIADHLIDLNHEVVIVDNLTTGSEPHIHAAATFYKVDITSEKLDDVFRSEQPEYVIHQAAQVDVGRSIADPVFDADVNIMGTLNVLKSCRKHGVKKLIYASSAAVYGDPGDLGMTENHPVQPESFYGVSKLAAENYLRTFAGLFGLNYAILRYANVYGPRQDARGEGGVISIFVHRLLNGETLNIFGSGEQTRDFVYVKDVVSANVAALKKGDRETINVSSNTQTSIKKLVTALQEVFDKKAVISFQASRRGDIQHSCLHNSKAENMLAWSPRYSLYEGLQEMA